MRHCLGALLLLACGGSAKSDPPDLPNPIADGGTEICTVSDAITGDTLEARCDRVFRAEGDAGCFMVVSTCGSNPAYGAMRTAAAIGCDVVLDPLIQCSGGTY